MHYLRKFTISIALLISFGIGAQNPETFKSPKKYLQIGFNFGKFEQEGLAPLHSDIGASLTMFHSFWILKPGTQRFKLGIEASWCDFDYNRYKVNMASEQDGSHSYTFHQGNIGAQIGLGVDFHFNHNAVATTPHFRLCILTTNLNTLLPIAFPLGWCWHGNA